MAVRTGGTSGR